MNDPLRAGHRERMREKFEKHGDRVLETYELLEMLLHLTIRRRDTRSIAKQLLLRFNGIEGVLSAGEDELSGIDGVGAATAALIKTVSELPRAVEASLAERAVCLDDYEAAGEFVHDYFRGNEQKSVIMLSLDANMELIGIDEICALDFDSGGVRPLPMIRKAIERRATVVILAHNHPFGALYPTEGDMQTGVLVADALFSAGIFLAENYVVNGEGYLGFASHLSTAFSQKTPVYEFRKSKLRALGSLPAHSRGALRRPCSKDSFLASLLRFSEKSGAEETARELHAKIGSLARIIESGYPLLKGLSTESAALAVRLATAVCGRVKSERLAIGKKNSEERITDHLSGYFMGMPVECVYAVMLDEGERVIATELISEGTLGASEIVPRRILDAAGRHGAREIILSHNHPSGTPAASFADASATAQVEKVLASAGIRLRAHYVVALGGVVDILRSCRSERYI